MSWFNRWLIALVLLIFIGVLFITQTDISLIIFGTVYTASNGVIGAVLIFLFIITIVSMVMDGCV